MWSNFWTCAAQWTWFRFRRLRKLHLRRQNCRFSSIHLLIQGFLIFSCRRSDNIFLSALLRPLYACVVEIGKSCSRWSETLIRLGGCPGWSESSLGTKVILLVLSWGGSKCFFLVSTYAAHIHSITFFTFCIEPNMKSFSHANNIVLRRDIYIHSLNWC